MSLKSRLDYYFQGSFNRTESIKNQGRILRAITWEKVFGKGPRVFANSVPKSGTHLLKRCLNLMPGIKNAGFFIPYVRHREKIQDIRSQEHLLRHIGPGCYVGAHLPCTEDNQHRLEQMGYKVLLMVRDPRDVVNSHFHHIMKRPYNRLHTYLQNLPDDEARILALINGIPDEYVETGIGVPDIGEHFTHFLEWLNHGAALIRFEHLVGQTGGGDAATQKAQITTIAQKLEIELSEAQREDIARRVFNRDSSTFRKGSIGDWKNHFQSAHKKAFKDVAGQILIDLGYEKDLSW